MAVNKKIGANLRHIKKGLSGSDNFLEALRDLGGGGEEATKIREEKQRRFLNFNQELVGLKHQEKLIWTHQEQETKLQVAAILEELKKLSKSVKQLDQEVEIATAQVPVEPGIYHLSFFEKLRQTIVLFRKRVEESVNWLATFNQRAKKRNHYWGQFKKSGTKFLLSQERYMSTQAG